MLKNEFKRYRMLIAHWDRDYGDYIVSYTAVKDWYEVMDINNYPKKVEAFVNKILENTKYELLDVSTCVRRTIDGSTNDMIYHFIYNESKINNPQKTINL